MAFLLGDHLAGLFGGVVPDDVLDWPPDVFAAAATALQASGAYVDALDALPREEGAARERIAALRERGGAWREALGKGEVEAGIRRSWARVLADADRPVGALRKDPELVAALLELLAVADESCEAAGVAGSDAAGRAFSQELLPRRDGRPASLARRVDASLLQVLPKLHVPQDGITVRSLSRNLAICAGGEVDGRWLPQVWQPQGEALNLLLVPWPPRVDPRWYVAVEGPSALPAAAENAGWFAYDPGTQTGEVVATVMGLLEEAGRRIGPIDMVVLPELSVSVEEWEQLAMATAASGALLVGGVRGASAGSGQDAGSRKTGKKADKGAAGSNHVGIHLPLGGWPTRGLLQAKHHRWRLDRRQIEGYGLGGRLSPGRSWWEYIALGPRQVNFMALAPWLTMAVLVCEDLARQGPATDLVRSVGPNLVLSLLMDGPQLSHRWSGRYATVLADDPGTAVLTVTSEGMCRLWQDNNEGSRCPVVALWKDGWAGSREIELPKGAGGVVLCVSRDAVKEYTADGRAAPTPGGALRLVGVHPVSMPATPGKVRGLDERRGRLELTPEDAARLVFLAGGQGEAGEEGGDLGRILEVLAGGKAGSAAIGDAAAEVRASRRSG